MAIKVMTDSTSYLSQELLDQYDIEMVTLSVVFDDEVIEEVSISNNDFYAKMDAVDYFPTSSQPSLEEVQIKFENHLKAGDDIVAVFISSEMSGTYQSAVMVKEQLLERYTDRRIEIIDSRVNCMELGFQAINAAKTAQRGADIDGVVKAAKDTLKRSRFIFTPSTLDYLRKGGRIGYAKALLGNVLRLKPILTVADGHTTPVTSVRTRNKSIDKIIQIFDEDVKEFGLEEVIVHHINVEKDARKLAEKFKEKTGIEPRIMDIGPVVGVHVGPGAIGVVYVTKEEIKHKTSLEQLENIVKDNLNKIDLSKIDIRKKKK